VDFLLVLIELFARC